MAPPAAKRRKLGHSDDSDLSEASILENSVNGTGVSDEALEDNTSSDDDDSTDEEEGLEDEDFITLEENGAEEEDSEPSERGNGQKKQIKAPKAREEDMSHKKQDRISQDGAYTAEVYKSNIFKLQVDELLEQVKLKYGKKEAPAETAMRTIKSIIEQIPSREPLSISEAEAALNFEKVKIPFPNPHPAKDAKYKLQYERPVSINATGSYPLKIATRTEDELAIDLVVTMPKSLFQEKDYLNHRYFYKRAYYLACVAAGIKSSKKSIFKIVFDSLNGNHLQPIVVIRPSGDGGSDDFSSSKYRIQIIPALPDNTFPDIKLLPSANCVRPKILADESNAAKLTPTPFYNATLQSDGSITAYLKLLHASSGKCDSYKDACILGRVWLRQRGFGGQLRNGGFGNFEWAAIIAILLQAKPGAGPPPLSPGYSSYQLFKATLQFLASRDLLKSPYVFQAREITSLKSELTPIFFDGPRSLNIFFKMTPWSYARLRQEAELTIRMLGDSTFDQFEQTFILKANYLNYRYDATLEIPLSAFRLDPFSEEYNETLSRTCRKLHSTLGRALTNRATTILIQMPVEEGWFVDSPNPPEDQDKSILICFATDPANASRTIDHGPAAENKKDAASFRQFWGEKAELRRFKDGSILESVVWSPTDKSSPVFEQIIDFVLRRHLGTQVADKAKLVTDSFAHLIPSGRIQGRCGTAPFLPVMNALATLEKDIRDLKGLPLQIRHIVAADSQLRYSSVEPPFTLTRPLMQIPASIVIQFEGFGRWPDDLSAIQRTKMAFLLKLSDLLSSARPAYTTRVGLENPSQPSQNQVYLDIILPSGPAFRLRIHHDREAALLDRQLKDKSLDGPSRESAASALAVYKREFLHIPAHTQAIQSLCTRFPALSPSIRLTKRWFASHHLLPHFSPEFIELLVVRNFSQPHPWPVPACATTGFLRTLAWISRWDWRHAPLIVDFSTLSNNTAAPGTMSFNGNTSTELKSDDINKIQTRFEAWRRIDPSLNRVVLFAATNLETEGTTWTDKAMPEKVVAARMTALARAAINVIRAEDDRLSSLLSDTKRLDEFRPETLFASRLQDYDILLHISPKFSKSGKKKPKSKFKNLQIRQDMQEPDDVQSVGYDPVSLFARELLDVYGDAILWFWDPEALDLIAGLWNPGVTGQRSWKVKVGWNSLPLDVDGKENKGKAEGVQIQTNKEAILNEIGTLGGELVEKIELIK
ncbi:Nrap protein [Zopfia rhizophila CBS 207.26]|uniref:U3 small nucleolar RNA-associated protein 22 n=1 Tax=Zopfia rhizophila CBS 207.26 TaxID=1314779 RepID=A0A6A6DA44_9PEZI|nr:Nrap protein [Zopfia rhizophila CBS 207.26]